MHHLPKNFAFIEKLKFYFHYFRDFQRHSFLTDTNCFTCATLERYECIDKQIHLNSYPQVSFINSSVPANISSQTRHTIYDHEHGEYFSCFAKQDFLLFSFDFLSNDTNIYCSSNLITSSIAIALFAFVVFLMKSFYCCFDFQ